MVDGWWLSSSAQVVDGQWLQVGGRCMVGALSLAASHWSVMVVVDQIYPLVVVPCPIGDGWWQKVDVQLVYGRSQAFEGGQAKVVGRPFSGGEQADQL